MGFNFSRGQWGIFVNLNREFYKIDSKPEKKLKANWMGNFRVSRGEN
jgi:hypothetical protein